jgi:CheY-like chemotaxis protein
MPAGTEPKHRVLLLDDDRRYVETVSELFTVWSQDRWQVFSAHNTARALALLQEHQFDLAVVDLNMPVVDGVQFLRLLNQRHPHLKKVVVTGYADENRRNECLANGAELFIEKPRTQDGFETVFATLNELLDWQTQEGFRGVLRKVGLQDVIQMECLGRNSSVLEVANQRLRGRIFIEQGGIVHAVAEGQVGVAAFNRLLALGGGEFAIRPFEPPPERTIEGQWEFLLMEAARQRDEAADQAAGMTPAPVEAHPGGELLAASPASVETLVNAAVARPEPQLEEVVLCGNQGVVLYEWQCRDADLRLKLFTNLAQRAQILSQLLPLGRFDRLEVISGPTRAVTHLAPDRMLFVRVRLDASSPPDS